MESKPVFSKRLIHQVAVFRSPASYREFSRRMSLFFVRLRFGLLTLTWVAPSGCSTMLTGGFNHGCEDSLSLLLVCHLFNQGLVFPRALNSYVYQATITFKDLWFVSTPINMQCIVNRHISRCCFLPFGVCHHV